MDIVEPIYPANWYIRRPVKPWQVSLSSSSILRELLSSRTRVGQIPAPLLAAPTLSALRLHSKGVTIFL
ncbi:hypothetical protein XELAEV_18023976mg [Xenopus laevis]|uniref:Uncharacterized protein n=1 Tax=Xenopus laevis TaxID=8355 RepID=A0A974D607_XENLA|nr:hypothetical protein XELAEV_18023976mg [Xenopus laevis]